MKRHRTLLTGIAVLGCTLLFGGVCVQHSRATDESQAEAPQQAPRQAPADASRGARPMSPTSDPSPSSAGGVILRVNVDAQPGGDGLSWDTAINDLQIALEIAADPNADVSEIWVAKGTYRPAEPDGPRDATFSLIEGVGIYGGFAGHEEFRDQRDFIVNETILSSDLNDDDIGFVNMDENSYHVVSAIDVDETAVLDGFTITSGNSNGSFPNDRGAGIRIFGDGPQIRNCFVVKNISNVTGGGISIDSSFPVIADSVFYNNVSGNGGAIGNRASIAVIHNCMFVGNQATNGGAVYAAAGATTNLANCVFSGNIAMNAGGAINNNQLTNMKVANCSFTQNVAAAGSGGIHNATASSTLAVANSILWENLVGNNPTFAAQVSTTNGTVSVDFSCVQNLPQNFPGDGNISENPLFVDPEGPDGEIGTPDDNLRLSPGSPAIDAGSNALVPEDLADLDQDGNTTEPLPVDLDHEPRFMDDPETENTGEGTPPIVDMGAYEFPGDVCAFADLNCDGVVDGADLGILLSNWGDCDDCNDCPADLNGDCKVDGADLGLLLANWG